MTAIYDRPFRVPVWLIIDLAPKKANELIERLVEEDGAYYQAWPARSFIDTLKELGRKGWSHMVDQKKPFTLDTHFLAVAVARHVKNVFGETTMLSGTHERPYQHLNRRIEKDSDFERLFNDVLANEQDVALSQIFGLAKPQAQVYVTDGNVNRFLVNRLAGKTLTVSETDGNVNVKGKKLEEAYDLICKELEKALKP